MPAKQYSDKLVSDAKDFSDEAVVVLTRVGGEGADLPTDMKAKGITYKNNSKDYDDFQKGESFLQLSKTERDMIDLVTSNFKKVTLVYNGANTFQFDFLNDYPQIQSVVWCPPAGQTGFSALGEVLAGETNPSGKTSDTFLKDLTKSVSYNNFGKFEYTNMADKAAKYKGFTGDDVTAIPGFVNYSEGIYVGYKFYETASDEGLINYDDTVAFPFGYGLSYTSFDQKLDSVKYKGGKVTVTATVTNTGDKAGKDVVEVYYNPPYTDGGIEKASKNLAGFEKTKELQPGESQKVTVKFDDDDMASYDYKGAKAYVLEKGDYDISIQSDSHHVIDHKAITVKDTVTYDSDSNTHNGDKTVATNQFDDVAGDVTYLSRADHFANYKEATAAPTNFKMSDKAKETFYNNSNYDPKKFDKDSDKMPTTGAKNGLKLSDMYGKDYDDAVSTRNQKKFQFEQAAADEKDAAISLNWTKVLAPASGFASRANLNPGSLVDASTSVLATITQHDDIRVTFAPSDRDLGEAKISLDSAVRVFTKNGRELPAKLDYVSQSLDPSVGTRLMRASLKPDQPVIPGEFVTVRLMTGVDKHAYRVPQRALLQRPDGTYAVYIVKDGKALRQTVTVGLWEGKDWIVLSGLEDGDRVITNQLLRIQDGMPVRLAESTAQSNKITAQ